MNKRLYPSLILLGAITFLIVSRQTFAWGPDQYEHTTHTDITAYAKELSIDGWVV